MKNNPRLNKFIMPLSSFDPELLPEGSRDPASPEYAIAISAQLTEEFSELGTDARIVVGSEFIEIDWAPSKEMDIFAGCIRLLKKGKYRSAIVLLRGLLADQPDNHDLLFNLGIALSDIGELDESIKYLKRLVSLAPKYVNGLISLGVALGRNGQLTEAIESLSNACELDPENAYVHRNLGGVLMKQGEFATAIKHLRRATELSPMEPGTWYGLGQAAFHLDDRTTATDAFRKVIDLAPDADIAESAKRELTKISELVFRKRGVSGQRPDAIEYCLSAMKDFSKLSDHQLKPILLELATKGGGGLDINDPEKRYTFDSIQGDFSGLQAVCYMYVAAQRVIPGQNLGIDLSKEFQLAKSMFNG